jgi:hypothetical protein
MDEPAWKKQKSSDGGHFNRNNYSKQSGGFGGNKQEGDSNKKSFGTGSLVSAANGATEEDWSIQEKRFTLDQYKAGAELRVREGRGKPLDIVFFYLGIKTLIFFL